MKRTISFLNGAFVGALAGALLALLLTPKSGQDLRDAIKREVDDIMTEGRRAAEQRQRELEAQLQQLWEQ
jgi:gas vesicle protein